MGSILEYVLDMLSIIIVAMGDSSILRECIDSLRKYVRLAHEIIIVNNSEAILPHGEETGIICLEMGRNLGFARGVNRGIEAASGEMILLLNPDTYFVSDILSDMVVFMDTHPQAGIVGPQLIFPDGTLQNSIDIIPNLATEFINKSLLKILFPKSYPSKRSEFRSPVRVPSIIGACMLIRRKVIDVIGLLDEGYFLYLEETDFCKRTSDAGFEIWHLPHLKIVHYQGVNAHQADISRKIEYRRSMNRFFVKHRRGITLLFILSLLKLVTEIMWGIAASISSKGRLRLKRSCALLFWHLSGMPMGRGIEKPFPAYRKVRKDGYTWFFDYPAIIPEEIPHPGQFKGIFNDEGVKRPGTTCVKSGIIKGRRILIKRYRSSGVRDSFKGLFCKGRAQRSFEGALMFRQCGMASPSVVFACEKRILGILVDSYIATEHPNAMDLVGCAETRECQDRFIRSAARYFRRLHEMGFILDIDRDDLFCGEDGITLLDLSRLSLKAFARPEAIARDLGGLNASFCMDMPLEKRRFFLDEYIKGNPVLTAKRPWLEQRIQEVTVMRMGKRCH